MTAELADSLAKRYIDRLESATKGESSQGHVCSIMDLFDSRQDQSRALNTLMKAKTSDVHLNYKTWNEIQ